MITRASPEPFEGRLEFYRNRVETHLHAALNADEMTPPSLADAMAYSVLGPGKRIRPLLCYASGELFKLAPKRVDAIAAAVELVHAYSLIHDDLPAMDDDDLRRGKPTAHKQYNEATAILSGDALQALAFDTICRDTSLAEHPPAQIEIIRWLARAIGPAGMVGGQLLDLQAEGREIGETELADIHRRKTGELIRASIMMPSELADIAPEAKHTLDKFASAIGLVFQIRDDLLEVEQDTETLGKSAGSDKDNEKSTYPAILGIEGARARADELYARATTALDTFGEESAGLRWVSDYILSRSN